jgi:hypothetical protein
VAREGDAGFTPTSSEAGSTEPEEKVLARTETKGKVTAVSEARRRSSAKVHEAGAGRLLPVSFGESP